MKTVTHLFSNQEAAIGFIRGVMFVNDSAISIDDDGNQKVVQKNRDPDTKDRLPFKVVTRDKDNQDESLVIEY